MTEEKRFLLPSDVVDARRDALERASVWREQAGVLRRRARHGGDVDESNRRAAWYEQRAEILSETMPQAYLPRPIYPRELATPGDVLHVVDELRHTVVEAIALTSYLRLADLDAFRRALVMVHDQEQAELPADGLERLERVATELAEALGALFTPQGPKMIPYEAPLIEDPRE